MAVRIASGKTMGKHTMEIPMSIGETTSTPVKTGTRGKSRSDAYFAEGT
jgi:hypothetical protein